MSLKIILLKFLPHPLLGHWVSAHLAISNDLQNQLTTLPMKKKKQETCDNTKNSEPTNDTVHEIHSKLPQGQYCITKIQNAWYILASCLWIMFIYPLTRDIPFISQHFFGLSLWKDWTIHENKTLSNRQTDGLTNWGQNQMAAMLQVQFWSTLSWLKIVSFWFPRVQLIMNHHWFM